MRDEKERMKEIQDKEMKAQHKIFVPPTYLPLSPVLASILYRYRLFFSFFSPIYRILNSLIVIDNSALIENLLQFLIVTNKLEISIEDAKTWSVEEKGKFIIRAYEQLAENLIRVTRTFFSSNTINSFLYDILYFGPIHLKQSINHYGLGISAFALQLSEHVNHLTARAYLTHCNWLISENSNPALQVVRRVNYSIKFGQHRSYTAESRLYAEQDYQFDPIEHWEEIPPVVSELLDNVMSNTDMQPTSTSSIVSSSTISTSTTSCSSEDELNSDVEFENENGTTHSYSLRLLELPSGLCNHFHERYPRTKNPHQAVSQLICKHLLDGQFKGSFNDDELAQDSDSTPQIPEESAPKRKRGRPSGNRRTTQTIIR